MRVSLTLALYKKVVVEHHCSINGKLDVQELCKQGCLQKVVGHACEQAPLDTQTYAFLLQSCAKARAWREGWKLQNYLASIGLEQDTYVSNLLINLHTRCGDMHGACSVFEKMHRRTLVSWNSMLTTYAENGCIGNAFKLFQRMLLEGLYPNKVTFLTLLNACTTMRDVAGGKFIHACVIDNGLECDPIAGTSLVRMYGSCGRPVSSWAVFLKLNKRDVILWTTMIAAFVECGLVVDALNVFWDMIRGGALPSKITFVTTLSALSMPTELEEGKLIHSRIMETGLVVDPVLATSLVTMYNNCGDLGAAWKVFIEVHGRDDILWTTMIAAYVDFGDDRAAFGLFQQMLFSCVPNKFTYITILDACCRAKGKLVHALVIINGLERDIMVGTALMNLYNRYGLFERTCEIFSKLEHDVYAWTTILVACISLNGLRDAFRILQEMKSEGVKPNENTYTNLLKACSGSEALPAGKMIHACILDGELISNVVGTALVNMYNVCRSVENAWSVFATLPSEKGDTFLCNAMMDAFIQNDHDREAFRIYRKLCTENRERSRFTYLIILSRCRDASALGNGKLIHASIMNDRLDLDNVIGNAVVNMYDKCEDIQYARAVFDKLQEPNAISWNTIITAYAHCGHDQEVLHLGSQMRLKNINTDDMTFMVLLNACSNLGMIARGKFLHTCILASDFIIDTLLETTLINMYGKCGSLDDAEMAFDIMMDQDAFSWTTIISIYAQHGHGKKVLQLFQQMLRQGLKSDEITFVSIFSACSHSGLVDEGCHYLSSSKDYNVSWTAEIYRCMIDLLGRAGWLDEAENFLSKKSNEHAPRAWMALLGACRIYDDRERGRQAAESILKIDPGDAAAYVALSNIYAI